MKKIHIITAVIASIALMTAGFMGARLLDKSNEPRVTAASIEERLSKCSDLTTARLDYRSASTKKATSSTSTKRAFP